MFILILCNIFILCVYPLISIHKNKKDAEEGIEIGREFDKILYMKSFKTEAFHILC